MTIYLEPCTDDKFIEDFFNSDGDIRLWEKENPEGTKEKVKKLGGISGLSIGHIDVGGHSNAGKVVHCKAGEKIVVKGTNIEFQSTGTYLFLNNNGCFCGYGFAGGALLSLNKDGKLDDVTDKKLAGALFRHRLNEAHANVAKAPKDHKEESAPTPKPIENVYNPTPNPASKGPIMDLYNNAETIAPDRYDNTLLNIKDKSGKIIGQMETKNDGKDFRLYKKNADGSRVELLKDNPDGIKGASDGKLTLFASHKFNATEMSALTSMFKNAGTAYRNKTEVVFCHASGSRGGRV